MDGTGHLLGALNGSLLFRSEIQEEVKRKLGLV